jgi:hypothetical protein
MDNIQVGNILKARAESIRASDPLQRPVFAHMGGAAIGQGMDWTYARCQDFLGCSCYPAWHPYQAWDENHLDDRSATMVQEAWNGVALTYDHIRSLNLPGRPVWAAEFQGGRVSDGFLMGRVPSAEDIRRWMLTAVASGVTAISFWVTRGEIMAQEANGFSLLDSSGESTDRIQEAGRIGSALNRHGDLFACPSLDSASIAIILNEENAKFNASMINGNGQLTYSTRGWHRLLWEMGIPVDFVELSYTSPEQLARYTTLVLPFPISISETLAMKLADYVEGGGNLICEANPGQINEHATANRGGLSPTLARLFGVQHVNLKMAPEPNGTHSFTPGPRTWGEYLDECILAGTGPLAGYSLRANVHLETFTCITALPLVKFGEEVAGSIRRAGKGQAILLGTYAGHCGTAVREQSSWDLIKVLLKICDIEPINTGKLLLRKRSIPGKQAWIFTNPNGQAVTETVDVGKAQVEDLLGSPFEQTGNQVKLTVDSADIRVLIIKT